MTETNYASVQTTCVCNGTGSYCVAERIKGCAVSGYSIHVCVCRKDEPVREGNARWWTKETVFSDGF